MKNPAGHHHDLPPLFRRALAGDWANLPGPVRQLHDFTGRRSASGTASVERGAGMASNLVAWLFGFPHTAASVPVQVIFEQSGTGEIWTRNFAGTTFTTRLEPVPQSQAVAHTLIESFGPLAFQLQLHYDRAAGRLYLAPVAWRFFGLPLPMALAPYGNSYEFAEAGQFAFHIEICIPFFGLIVRYRGNLEPDRGQK